jgi:hypothetical protein
MIGIAFSVGVPLGVGLAVFVGFRVPYYLSILLILTSMILVFISPVDDTLGIKEDTDQVSHCNKCSGDNRYIPNNWLYFFKHHFPFSIKSFHVMRESNTPLDWLTYYLLFSSLSTVVLIFVQYCFIVFQWGGLTSAAAIVYLGIAIAIISPTLLSKYDSLALVTYCSFVFGLGISIFSIAGTGISWGKFLVYPGLIFIPIGMAWIGALETIITTQYGPDKQGIDVS